jgi:hypothetical protein
MYSNILGAVDLLDPTDMGIRVIEDYRDDLFSLTKVHIAGANNTQSTKPRLELSLAALNRSRIRKLQMKLVQHILYMRYYKEEPKYWEDLLKEYSKSIQGCLGPDEILASLMLR